MAPPLSTILIMIKSSMTTKRQTCFSNCYCLILRSPLQNSSSKMVVSFLKFLWVPRWTFISLNMLHSVTIFIVIVIFCLNFRKNISEACGDWKMVKTSRKMYNLKVSRTCLKIHHKLYDKNLIWRKFQFCLIFTGCSHFFGRSIGIKIEFLWKCLWMLSFDSLLVFFPGNMEFVFC